MNGLDPPDPLDPATLARLLDLDGSRRRAFKASVSAMNSPSATKALAQAVSHRTPEADARIDQLEAKYGLKQLYGD